MVIFLPENREHVKCHCDNVDDVRFVLDQYGQLDFDSASSLNHQSAPLRAIKQSDKINQGK
jgi:hypothetical protein